VWLVSTIFCYNIAQLIIRLHLTSMLMRPIVADWLAWCVCLSVCLSVSQLVCHTSEPCKNNWTDRGAVWGVDSGWPREPCVRWWSRSPHAKGQFWWAKSYLHGKWLAETARSTILQQQHSSFREMLVLWSRASVCLSVRSRTLTLLHGPGCNLAAR